MRQFNYLQAIVMSFYSRALYRDVARNWGAETILYLFLVLLLSWIAMMFVIQPAMTAGANHIATKYADQLPTITVTKGVISTPEKKPYIIKDPDTQQVVAIIDTSGQYKNLEQTPAAMLVTQDGIFYKENPNLTKIQKLPETLSTQLEPNVMKEKLLKFAKYAWILLLPLFLLISFGYRLLQSLVYALFGKLFALIANINLSYGEILKLTMVAITPSIILGTILDIGNAVFHFEWLLYFVISMAYLIFAIYSTKEN